MKPNLSLFTCAALLAGTVSLNAATVINVNFGAAKTEADLIGPIGTTGETWNQNGNTKSGTDLTDFAGGATTIDWSISGSFNNGDWGSSSTLEMLESAFWLQDSNVRTLTISGLDSDKKYHLYIASFDQNSWTNTPMSFSTTNATTTVGSQVAANTVGNAWTLDNNYVLFEDLVANGSSQIAIDGVRVSGGLYGMWNGFQLVEVAAVPEPSPAALIGLAGFALLLRRRKS